MSVSEPTDTCDCPEERVRREEAQGTPAHLKGGQKGEREEGPPR